MAHLDLITIKCILQSNSPNVHFFLHAICGPGIQTISDYQARSQKLLLGVFLDKMWTF